MKVRIISALVGIVVLVGVLCIPSPVAVVAMCAVLSAAAVFELLYNTGIMQQKSLLIFSMVFTAIEIPLCSFIHHFQNPSVTPDANLVSAIQYVPLIVLASYVVVLLIHSLIPAIRVTWESAQYAFLLTLYSTLGFGSMALLRLKMNIGWWLVILLLVIAWMNDTGAYFVGVLFGKHKMAPKVSPKKSWEGFFGGWIVSVLCAVLLFILRFEIEHTYGENVFHSLYILIPVAFLLAPLSVCGDLLASFIKRKCGLKDFSNIMPGHGGVMDRFDSVIFIAPFLYLIVSNYSVIQNFMARFFV